MSGIPRLDKSASLLAGAAGAVVMVVVFLMGSPVSTVGYFFATAGLVAMAWAAFSRLSESYS